MFGVYCLKDSEGTVRYIGKGKAKSDGGCGRWKDHASLANSIRKGRTFKKKAYRIHHWMAKHAGWSFCWLLVGLTEKQAYAKERELVEKYRAKLGRELLNSSEGGRGMTSEEAMKLANRPEVKEKKKKNLKKRWKDPEYRANMKEKLKEANGRDYRRQQAREKANEEWKSKERRESARKRANELWADPVWAAQRRKELRERNKKKKEN